MSEKMVNLFVYGTLRCNEPNSYLLFYEDSGCELISTDCTLRGYEMYSLGGYPAITESENPDAAVKGDLVRVPEGLLKEAIDRLEGYSENRRDEDNYYLRKIGKVTDENGQVHDAWFYCMEVEKLQFHSARIIPDGDWCRFRKEGNDRPHRSKASLRR